MDDVKQQTSKSTMQYIYITYKKKKKKKKNLEREMRLEREIYD